MNLNYNSARVEVFCWTVSVVCGTMAGATHSKISNRHSDSNSNQISKASQVPKYTTDSFTDCIQQDAGGWVAGWLGLGYNISLTAEVLINNTNILILRTLFVVLSSWQSNCKSSPGSFDECGTAPSGCQPSDQVNWLGPWGCHHLHPPLPFSITQPES